MAGANTLALKAKPVEGDNKDEFLVKDPSCTAVARERTHDVIVNGEIIPVVFKYGEDKKLPRAAAMKLLASGFTVIDGNGNKVDPTPAVPEDGKIVLTESQVIADLNELSNESLWKRCLQEIGGEKFSRSDAKRDMVAFLVEKKKESEAARRGAKENGADEFTPPAEID